MLAAIKGSQDFTTARMVCVPYTQSREPVRTISKIRPRRPLKKIAQSSGGNRRGGFPHPPVFMSGCGERAGVEARPYINVPNWNYLVGHAYHACRREILRTFYSGKHICLPYGAVPSARRNHPDKSRFSVAITRGM